MTFLAWFVEHLADVRSDMSRFHRVDDIEAMRSDRFVEYVARLHSYGGVIAETVRRALVEEAEQAQQTSPAANPTGEDLARMFPAAPSAGQMAPIFEHTVV